MVNCQTRHQFFMENFTFLGDLFLRQGTQIYSIPRKFACSMLSRTVDRCVGAGCCDGAAPPVILASISCRLMNRWAEKKLRHMYKMRKCTAPQ